ncbi:MAG: TIGR03667 family PPOX class F420-dependent oxidoreductase [Anaerolineae bacterium]
MAIDRSHPKYAHVERRLYIEPFIWLSSVRPDGRPHLVPVWFLWDGETLTIFSQPNNQKIRNLRANPHVTVALEAANEGEDVAILEGTAQLLSMDAVAPILDQYREKYEASIIALGMTPETMMATYSQPIRVTPTRLITW